LSSKRFPKQKEMTDKDFLIICGDFGGVWCGDNEELYWRKWLDKKNFTTLFIDGNHENFDMLGNFPIVDFCEGKAHQISNNIYHLMRGQIYTLDSKKIFTLGGASSHDKEFRKEGKSWWKEELPSKSEYNIATESLSKADRSVDIVITHSAPTSIQRLITPIYEENTLTDFLEDVNRRLKFNKWFFGHYHLDMTIEHKFCCMFNHVEKLF
jgi:hypothetical protein